MSDNTARTKAGGIPSKPWLTALVLVGAAGLLALVSYWPGAKPTNRNDPVPANAAHTKAMPATTATSATADLQFLKGRWLRPDGGYILEIRQVDANGQLDAGYFNPNPIRVTSAVAKRDGAATKVLIELNDVNYPGCKYNLTYIPDKDWLAGTYFQAAMGQTFEVAFERER